MKIILATYYLELDKIPAKENVLNENCADVSDTGWPRILLLTDDNLEKYMSLIKLFYCSNVPLSTQNIILSLLSSLTSASYILISGFHNPLSDYEDIWQQISYNQDPYSSFGTEEYCIHLDMFSYNIETIR